MKKNQPSLAFIFILCLLISGFSLNAQYNKDSLGAIQLKSAEVKAYRTINGMGHMHDEQDQLIYAGKKTELLLIDTIDANKAVNNTRQILGRIPGLNIVESETGGFISNGIATRGLDPNQSIEMNVLQNGYNIAADIFGYNETYYLPPMEAVERIEAVRGASSLQFGPQFGGVVNYVLKGSDFTKPLNIYSSQTGGSFGLFNSFNSIGGRYKKISYYSYVQYRHMNGWRPNSDQNQWSAFASFSYKPVEKLSIGLEYSLSRNLIHMPGGLSDEQYAVNARSSFRARNWLRAPWNIVALRLNYAINKRSSLSLVSTYKRAARELIWRNESGGPETLDTINLQTGTYDPREAAAENFSAWYNDIRFLGHYHIRAQEQTIAVGGRIVVSHMHQQGGGEGSTGSDAQFGLASGAYEYDLQFKTINASLYAENIFKVAEKLTITPGFRLEYVNSGAKGYITDVVQLPTDKRSTRVIPLFGIGIQYAHSSKLQLYANVSRAYRPIDYSALTPIGVSSRIDPKLHDASGYNGDIGLKGNIKNIFNYDFSAFLLVYQNRIGLVEIEDRTTGEEYALRTNVANSLHTGLEGYFEINMLKLFQCSTKTFQLSIFNSSAWVHARYTSGAYNGKRVEYAPEVISRSGLNFRVKGFSTSWQCSYQSFAYGDASNEKHGDEPGVGFIPSYYIMDLSASYTYKNVSLKAGLNNITDQKYFTRRADEYPGPGIIPSIGRNYYAGISAKF